MRFDRLRARNMGPFGDVDLDLTQVAGPLVALVGPNGAGKTTALELLPGALFRQCPTRGKLSGLATACDSFVEVEVCNGQSYRVRQTIDAHTGHGDALIVDGSGQPVTPDSKRSKADKWVAEHFPSPEVLYSSSIQVQGKRGLLDMTSGERKSVLLQALGIDYLETRAEQARDKARAAKVHADTLRARIADVQTVDLEVFAMDVARAQRAEAEAAELTRAARVALERAKAAAADSARAAELAEQRRAAQKRLDAAREQADNVERRLRNNRTLLDEADAIRAAEVRARQLDAELKASSEALAALTRAYDLACAEERAARAQVDVTKQAETSARQRAAAIEKRLADAPAIRAAAERVREWQTLQEPEFSARVVQGIEEDIAGFEAFVLGAKEQRIAGLRQGLEAIVRCQDRAAPLQTWADDTLTADDQLEADAREGPETLRKQRAVLTTQRESLRRLREDIATTRATAGRLPDLEGAERELMRAREDVTAADQAVRTSEAALADAQAKRVAAGQSEKSARIDQHQKLEGERQALGPVLAKLDPLNAAVARIEELEAQLPVLSETIARAQAELASLPEVDAQSVDLTSHELTVAEYASAERAANAKVAQAQAAETRAKSDMQKRRALAAQLVDADIELSDWTRLGQDLGRDGLQAYEIDAAIPEINAIANDLLSTCHGSRFTVDIRAERLSADGKTTLEGLQLRVIDTERGRDALAESYSGGECVIVGEALALAVTTIACRKAGVGEPTLIRDESGAALDPENGRAYVAMLRMAARQIGARHVLFVSHNPELSALADTRLLVADGRIEVQV